MNTVKHCLRCGQWFNPLHVDDLLCHTCKVGKTERVVMWWVAFAGAMIGIVIMLLLKDS